MDNRFLHLELRNGSVATATSEVWVRADVEHPTPGTELRGRLMGPRCRFAATVEVAYPLRPFVQAPEGFAGLSGRVVIPEASLWDPESPFLYEGAIELWQDGNLCERRVVSHGLRILRLDKRGLCVNGRRLILNGRSVTALNEAEALALRAAGVNLLVVPVAAETEPIWKLADRIGLLVLGRVGAVQVETATRVEKLGAHASCFGWLVPNDEAGRFACRGFVGAMIEERSEGVDFVVADAERADHPLPVLVRGTAAAGTRGMGRFE